MIKLLLPGVFPGHLLAAPSSSFFSQRVVTEQTLQQRPTPPGDMVSCILYLCSKKRTVEVALTGKSKTGKDACQTFL